IDAAEVFAGAVVVELQIEVVEAHTRHDLQLACELNLVLHVSGGDIGDEVIVGVRGALAEDGGDGDQRVRVRDQYGRRWVVEVPGVAEVVRKLAAEFEAREYSVLDGAGAPDGSDIGLVEDVTAARGVVIGGDGNLRFVRGYRAGDEVLVAAIVIAQHQAIAEG